MERTMTLLTYPSLSLYIAPWLCAPNFEIVGPVLETYKNIVIFFFSCVVLAKGWHLAPCISVIRISHSRIINFYPNTL